MEGNNVYIPMTRRYFDLPSKIQHRDSKVAKKLINAWDIEGDSEKVLNIFLRENKLLSDQRYWELLRTVWILCGTLENAYVFSILMKSNRKFKYCFSTPEESDLLKSMPDRFTVFRACNDQDDGGLSWTTSSKYAMWYRNTYDKKCIVTKDVNKSDVFAFINRNNEDEVLILPD